MEVKLDVDLDVRSITIETNGRLVWDSGRDSFVRTHYIYIRGTMEIGSEDCQFQKNAEIILKGLFVAILFLLYPCVKRNVKDVVFD